MTGTAITVVAKAAVTGLVRKFGSLVVERWSRYRAQEFFTAFVEESVNSGILGTESAQTELLLDEILADHAKSEVLFEAYRRVCLATSKTIGPRIVGLLTAHHIAEGRVADSSTELVFLAAESLSDGEFLDFLKDYGEHRRKAEGITDTKAEYHMVGDAVVIRWYEESGNELEVGPMPWEESLGRWSRKMSQIGIVSERTRHSIRKHHEFGLPSSEREYSAHVVTTITLEKECAVLYRLIPRALGPADQ